VVSRPSAEAEYRARADTTTEIIWLQKLLWDMGIDCVSPEAFHLSFDDD